ncbi:MAG: WD40/YVTN/BNR-like repeat-containing protein [Candidatus Omnitrophota bacterium]
MKKIVFSFAVVWISIMGNALLAGDFNWEDIGRENLNCQTLLVAAQDSKIIFAGKPGNILKTDNAGKSWRRVLAVKARGSDINALAMEKNNSNVVYAATGNGLYRGSNLGERWERIFRGKTELENQCMAVLSSAEVIFLGTKAGLFISRDSGRSWHKQRAGIGSSGILNIESVVGQNAIVYLAASSGIFKSLDDGKSWEKIFVSYSHRDSEEEMVKDEPEQLDKLTDINFVKTDIHNSNLMYFASTRGVYRSANQGQSWEKLTEYGLLNRDVKMICLADSSEIYALTSSGVFFYSLGRWIELSFSLAVGKFNYLALDDKTNIYIAGEKGVYKTNPKNTVNFLPSVMLQEYLKYEPGVRDVQEAAIKYAEVGPEKIAQWRKGASRKALLPQVSIGLDRNSTDLWHWEGGSTTKSDDDVLRRGRDNIDWDVSLSWDLSDLIWNDAQTSIDVRSKLMVELRDDILDQVNKLYFERLRVKSELDNLAPQDRSKRFDKQLKLQELTASLDALTSGYYSEQLGLLAAKQQS